MPPNSASVRGRPELWSGRLVMFVILNRRRLEVPRRRRIHMLTVAASELDGGWYRPRNSSPPSHKAPLSRQIAHPTTLSAQAVMPVGRRLAGAGLVWMAFFKSA